MRKIYLFLIALTAAVIVVDNGDLTVPAYAVTLGIVRGALIIVDLYVAFMWIYFMLRKKIQSRYGAEVIVIAAVIALSVAGKMLISYFSEVGGKTFVDIPRDAWDSTAKFYYSLYQALGGISFEGLAEYELYETWRTMCYAGSSLIAGLVAISILTFSISYEIYSWFAWANFGSKNRAKIYVFTAVTEDSVALAHSIDKANREKRKAQTFSALLEEEKKVSELTGKASYFTGGAYLRALYRYIFRRRKCAIIFLRTEDKGGFDSKDPLHSDIMHSGFLFRSYSPGRNNHSFSRFLRLRVKNDGCLTEGSSKKYTVATLRDEVAELHVFALDWEKGKTSENDNIIYGDISRMTVEVFGKPATLAERIRLGMPCAENADKYAESRSAGYHRVIDYHYLVSEEIDLSNVDMRFDNEMCKFVNDEEKKKSPFCLYGIGVQAREEIGKDKPGYKKYYSYYKRHFGLHVINEAHMAATLYIKERAELIRKFPEVYREDVKSDKYNAMFVGFGQNGQQTLKAAYIYAASGKFPESEPDDAGSRGGSEADEEWLRLLRKSPLSLYEPQPFHADVYDKNADDLGGLFKMKHQSFAVILPHPEKENQDDGTDGTMGGFYHVRRQSSSAVSSKVKADEYPTPMVPVRIRLHQDSAYSETILKMLDRNLGENISRYNLIAIALGDDDSNVNIANALLEDCKHEFTVNAGKGSQKATRYQVFAINLRDRLNFDRVNWCAKDERDYPNLKVIIYGSAEDMYSYENLVDCSLAKRWNSGYSAIQGGSAEGERLKNDVARVLAGNADVKIGDYLQSIQEKANDLACAEKDWRTLGNMNLYSKNSSSCAARFSPYVAALYKAVEGENAKPYPDILLKSVIRLGAVEHDRWIRFVVSNGYIVGKPKSKHIRVHPDIVPYADLNSQLYDMANIFNAFAVEYEKERKQN